MRVRRVVRPCQPGRILGMTPSSLAVQRLTLTVACLAQGMMVLDVLIVSVALPAIQHELRLSPSGLEWIVSAYALALAALIPAGGALGDHFGRKRVFIAGVVIFTLASVGCALSESGGMLIGFRVVQGVGGAVMSSLTLALISEAYPPERRSGPIGLWAAVSGLAVAGGSVIGGLLLSVFSWSSIFWVNVLIGVLTIGDLRCRCQGVASAGEQPAGCARSYPERRRIVPADVRLHRLGRCDVALAARRRLHRCRHRGSRGVHRARAHGGVAHGAEGADSDGELRAGVHCISAGLPGIRRVHLLRDTVFPEHRAIGRRCAPACPGCFSASRTFWSLSSGTGSRGGCRSRPRSGRAV